MTSKHLALLHSDCLNCQTVRFWEFFETFMAATTIEIDSLFLMNQKVKRKRKCVKEAVPAKMFPMIYWFPSAHPIETWKM